MGLITEIEWTDHTFNGWWGCVKVSPACKNCYAMTDAKRHGHNVWGADANRRMLSDDNWSKPLEWDRLAKEEGVRRKVFCSSMSDVFEDNLKLLAPRKRIWSLIEQTPNLDWQLLTKRPGNVMEMVPASWNEDGWPPNVWIGTTVENQKYADSRLPILLAIPAAVRFISAEPLLGSIDITKFQKDENLLNLDWVIDGGESGSGSRVTNVDWFRSLRDQCQSLGIAYFHKQNGEYVEVGQSSCLAGKVYKLYGSLYRKGGKKNTGALLDGRTWKQFPNSDDHTPG